MVDYWSAPRTVVATLDDLQSFPVLLLLAQLRLGVEDAASKKRVLLTYLKTAFPSFRAF